jgi:tetratricopeptide (TPR) repeat protein
VREPDQNLEKAINCYKAALEVRTKEASPYYWASSQFSLGNAYCVMIRGNRAENLENAIACYQDALQVYTRDAYPERWANAQTSLGGAYLLRVQGDQAKNLDKAIACYEAALEVYKKAFPRQAAQVQEELEDAYRQRKELYQDGETPDFLHQVLQAIRKNLYSQAFRFRTANLDKLTDQLKNDKSARLSNLIEHSPHNSLDQIMQVIGRAVHPILEANLDKLTDNNFADQFRRWATAKLSEEKGTETADAFVGIIGFSDLIQHFPLGDRANNLEIAIAGYEVVTTFVTREAFPKLWAMTQINLGTAYKNRIRGEGADNLERSILSFQEALQILKREEFPQQWAMLQGNLAAAYSKRIRGKVAENLETAIRCCEASLEVFTHKAFPEEWAKQQHNLGNIYLDRILDERAKNLEIAIELIESALQVLTYEAFPEQWANSQNTLAVAYEKRIRGDQAENLEKAIALYQAVLRVRTREAFPHDWAQTQMNLANAYRNQIGNNPVENLEKAIAHYQLALQVYTQQAFPEKWAMTQNNLGMAYSKRIDDAEYQERAIAAYEAALQVYSQETFPQQWAMTQKNLGIVYSVRIAGNRAENLSVAMTAFQSASQILTRNDFPLLWARNQYNQSVAYCYQGKIDEAITCCRSALEFYQPNTFPVECFTTGRELGQVGVAAKRWDIAIEGYSLAIDAVETSRTWTTSESRRQEILAQAIDVYHNIVFCCINAGQLEKAIEYVERSRSKRLVDLMASNDIYQGGEIPPEVKVLLQRFDELQQRIDQERSQNNSGDNRELMGVGTSRLDRATFQAYNPHSAPSTVT